MASLLTSSDIAQAFQAFEDTMDTFFTLPVVYQKAVAFPDSWGEKDNEQFTDYNLLAFYKESDNQTDTVEASANGAYDVNDGYFLFSYEKLDVQGLVSNGLPTLNPTTDYIVANGKTYEIIAVAPLGLFVDRYSLVKAVVRKIPNSV